MLPRLRVFDAVNVGMNDSESSGNLGAGYSGFQEFADLRDISGRQFRVTVMLTMPFLPEYFDCVPHILGGRDVFEVASSIVRSRSALVVDLLSFRPRAQERFGNELMYLRVLPLAFTPQKHALIAISIPENRLENEAGLGSFSGLVAPNAPEVGNGVVSLVPDNRAPLFGRCVIHTVIVQSKPAPTSHLTG